MNPSTALARVLVDELARCGLTEVVIAPGSRSAPLAMAAYDESRLRLHTRIDERSACYLALGLAKQEGHACAVVCTSGTAAANLHPAVVEAAHAGVPLLVLTADRPPELRGTGANQTIDQIKLYGEAVRWFCDVGVPEARPGAVAYWRSVACRAWAATAGPDPGPVHLNVTFREPLVPDESPDWPEALEGRPGGAPWTAVWPAPAGSAGWTASLADTERGLLVVGDGHPDPAPYVALAHARGWPVVAEPTSGARYGPNALSAHHWLLGAPGFRDDHRPEVVVTVGKPGLSRPVLALLDQAPEHVAVSAAPRWADPARSASRVFPEPYAGGPHASSDDAAGTGTASRETGSGPGPSRASRRGAGNPHPQSPESAWLRSWREADQAARTAIDTVLDAESRPTEPRLARDLAAELPEGALLFAGSSMPVRDLDRMMRPRAGVGVIANRGASGIDGSVSTAVGAALAHGGPAYALLGDVALLHDHNGLMLGPEEPRPDLTVVVVNNDGGGIFSLLPQASHPESFERLFGTPHGADLERMALAAGVPYVRLDRPDQLPQALHGEGLRLVEVPTDRAQNRALHARLQQAVDAAVSRPSTSV